MLGLLILATTAAATTGDDKGLYIGGATLVSIVTAVLGYFKGRAKNINVSPQPFQVERPDDNAFVTNRTCELRMCNAKRDLVEWNRRIEDKLDGITKFLMEHKK